MDKESFTQLTNNLYRLTLLFPKKEPLRYKMRELADEILAGSILINLSIDNPSKKSSQTKENQQKQELLHNLEVLDSFFEIAKAQNWVSPSDILRVQEEYIKAREELKGTFKRGLEESLGVKLLKPAKKQDIETTISERQQKILDILKEKDGIQVWEIKKVFPEVTKRTLRRDFEFLLKKGIIKRMGEKNETFYQINS
ncbi:DeoR family transcriptional regulator [Patescibacteria group bacterium]